MTKAQERIAVFVFGVVFISTMLVLAIKFPELTPFQYLVFKVVLALAAAGVAAMIPGFLEVSVSNWLKAGGALAVFALVMYKNPTALVVPPPQEKNFHNPQYRGKRLDICYTFANGCGLETAMKWCRDKGYTIAVDFEVDSEVGKLGVPTINMGSEQVCNQQFCTAFRSITYK